MENNHCKTPDANHCGAAKPEGEICGASKCMGKKKKCLNTILAMVLFAAANMAVCYAIWMNLFFDVWNAPEMKVLFREETDPLSQYCWVTMLLTTVIFVGLFRKYATYTCSPCGTKFGRGAMFGFHIFLISGLIGSLNWFFGARIVIEIFYASLLSGFFGFVIGGGLVGLVLLHCNKKTECSK